MLSNRQFHFSGNDQCHSGLFADHIYNTLTVSLQVEMISGLFADHIYNTLTVSLQVEMISGLFADHIYNRQLAVIV